VGYLQDTSGIGNHRLVRGPSLTTSKVRLRITRSPVCPALAELGLYAEPTLPPEQPRAPAAKAGAAKQ
jgi:hypothetical protein